MTNPHGEGAGVSSWEAEGVFVKVCGLARPVDVEAAAEAGADAVGFVHWEPSPRHQTLERIRELVAVCPVTSVLVTADLGSEDLLEAATRTGVGAVQVHGPASAVAAAAARRMGLYVIRPMRAGEDPPRMHDDEMLLVDSPHSELPGGSGETFDWEALKGIHRPFLLAGGLGPRNVAEAVRKVRPFGVDASSGLESSPGVKDTVLIREFVQAAKESQRP
ncbi:MAG: phosphoribosylanthranilate isomerase [Actinomycetota bacterium]